MARAGDDDDAALSAEYEKQFADAQIPHLEAPDAPGPDPYVANAVAATKLNAAARSGELRDVDLSETMHAGLFGALSRAWEAVPVASADSLADAAPAPSSAPPSVVGGGAVPGAEVLTTGRHPRLAFLDAVYGLYIRVIAFAEFDATVAARVAPSGFPGLLLRRCLAAPESEQDSLRRAVQGTYQHVPALRPTMRRVLGEVLRAFGAQPAAQPGVTTLLRFAGAILHGIQPASPSAGPIAGAFLRDCLMPIHGCNAMLSEERSLLGMFHDPLVYAVEQSLRLCPDAALDAWNIIVELWPPISAANSPKRVLLMHELDRLLKRAVPGSAIAAALESAAPLMAEAAASEYSQLAQRLLSVFREPASRKRLAPFAGQLNRALVPALLRGGSPHWNSTVNKQTRAVLAWLAGCDPGAFAEAASATFGGARALKAAPPSSSSSSGADAAAAAAAPAGETDSAPRGSVTLQGRSGAGRPKRARVGPSPSDTAPSAGAMPPPPQRSGEAASATGSDSLARRAALRTLVQEQERQAMARMGVQQPSQPPASSLAVAAPAAGSGVRRGGPVKASHAAPVPAGVVGGLVASGMATAAPFAGRAKPSKAGADPPVTVTGVAPWSMAGKRVPAAAADAARAASSAESGAHSSVEAGGKPAPSPSSVEALPDSAAPAASSGTSCAPEPAEPQDEDDKLLSAGLALLSHAGARERLGKYLDALRPPPLSAEAKAAAAAAAAPVEDAEGGLTLTPTLLPGLRLQDLVFGQKLGSGTFSTVKWCKRIVKGAPQSEWPEFAAKIISADTIRRLGYERSIEREVAVLRRMAHPGVARLVASFRYGSGAYLVLEYGSRGDLHSHITRLGSLSEESARFALGELTAALSAVHRAGFAYGDLKPENIILTGGGHVKLTDFGGARPVTQAAVDAVKSERNVLRRLTDGSWQAALADAAAAAGGSEAAAPATGAEAPAAAAVEAPAASGASPSDARSAEDAKKGGKAGETDDDDDDDDDDDAEDDRVETTAVYMAPELVHGGRPSVATDCWALGCVLYFALAGRPPVWAESHADMMRSIVEFDVASHFPDDFPVEAKSLVSQLLSLDPEERTRGGTADDPLAGIKAHPFFGPLGAHPDALHAFAPPPLAGGSVAPQADATWSKRQFSMFVAPVSQVGDFDQQASVPSSITESEAEMGAPFVVSASSVLASLRAMTAAPGATGPLRELPADLEDEDEDEGEDEDGDVDGDAAGDGSGPDDERDVTA